jgi:predicted DNA-binding transcriptional regulator AlpA
MPRFRPPETSRTDGFAREEERRAITGIPTSTWYVLQVAGKAPRPIRLGTRAVGWDRRELFEFNEQRKAERDAAILKKLGTQEPTTDDERGAVRARSSVRRCKRRRCEEATSTGDLIEGD